MAANKGQSAVTMKKETMKFRWRIDNFSKLKETKLYSDTFLAGDHKWRILVYPKGNAVECLSVYLVLADCETRPHGWSVLAEFCLTLVDQLNATSSSPKTSLKDTHRFHAQEYDWGFKSLVPIKALHLPSKGFLVNDSILIEAEVSTEAAAPGTGEPKVVVKAADQPIKASLTDQPLSPKIISKVQLDNTTNANGTISNSPIISPATVQSTSRKLIEELSAMTSASGETPSSSADPEHGSGHVMQQQREKMVGILGMSLEALSESKSLDDEIENIAVELAEHATDVVEETVLKYLVSRLAEFKEIVPASLSTIETSHAVESSVAQMKKDMDVRLVHRKRQLSSLEVEVSRLGEEETKLEAEIQRLSARRAKIVDHRNSTAVELDKANQEASKELEELKKQCDESKRAVENRMRAKERLAQSNTSWKLFKENLGW